MRRFALGAVAVLALPASAAAHGHPQTIAPPGNAGVQQYVETIPTAHGGQTTSSLQPGGAASHGARGGGGGHGGRGGGAGTPVGASGAGAAISPATQRALKSPAAGGTAAAAFIQATAPRKPAARERDRERLRASGQVAGAGAPATSARARTPVNAGAYPTAGSSPATSVFRALTGSAGGGLGSILPIVLIASLLAISVLAIMRRKRAT